ncbi:MAG: AMP-binding protein [Solirubrobacterales bacterium 70-9]|nr:MAG: AMP-binding protein [Solirubrobacterales bacterium 70-9]
MAQSQGAGPTEQPLLEETIGANFERTAARWPEREALVVRSQGVRLTYGELQREVDRVARGLIARGLEAGDRLGIWAPNRAEWVLIQYATAKIGVVLVNLNPAYRTTELAHALGQSACRALVAAREFKGSSYVQMLESMRSELPQLELVAWLDTPDWPQLLAAGDGVSDGELAARAAGVDPGDPINIQFTSGTTGSPKGATLSHRNILNNGWFTGAGCGYEESDRVCIPVPFYHCFGMVLGNLACTSHGACIVVPGEAFDPQAALAATAEERCTSLYGVPTMFIAMLDDPSFEEYDLASLRTGIMAGSPCPVEVMRRVVTEMNMSGVTICYGMTETSPVSTQTAQDDPLEKRVGTVGRVHPHVEIRIVERGSNQVVERGEDGELCTRGYGVMLGYWEDPARTAEVIDAEGWMHTGDLATMDGDGYVNIIGRSKDMIIRGGENVYPREIEEFLYTHPDIRDVQVIGVPDRRYGEELMAWIVVRGGASLDTEAVTDYCRGRIAHYKIPRYVKFVEEFPMTVTGKVQKFRMREVAIAELGLADQIAETA